MTAILEDEPEKAPGEMRQGLDFCGKWEGTWRDNDGKVWRVKLDNFKLIGCSGKSEQHVNHFRPLANCEGMGRFTIRWANDLRRGIFEHRGEWVIICFYESEKGPPTTLQGGSGRHLFILRRVKPRK
jgi:hypothetical protein